MSDAEDQLNAEMEAQANEATSQFQEALQTEDPMGVVREFGELVTGMSHAVGDFGDGLGEVLEESSQKAFGSEEFGSSFFPEMGEAFMSVIGEGTEAITEATGNVGEAAGVAIGGAIEAVGGIGEHTWDAMKDVADGDLGDAAENIVAAVRSAAGLGETAVDVTGALISGGAELVEGAGAVAWEIGEGAVEMVAGGAGDLADLAEGAWDSVNPFD